MTGNQTTISHHCQVKGLEMFDYGLMDPSNPHVCVFDK